MSAWTSPQLPPGFRSKAKAESPRLRNLSWFRLVWMELKAFVENNIGFHLASTPTCFVECFGGCLGPKTFKKTKKKQIPEMASIRKWYVFLYAFLRPYTGKIRPLYGLVWNTYFVRVLYAFCTYFRDFQKSIKIN